MSVSEGRNLYIVDLNKFCSRAMGISDPQLNNAFPYLLNSGTERVRKTQAKSPEDAGVNVLCRVLKENGGHVTGAYAASMRNILQGFGSDIGSFVSEYHDGSGCRGTKPVSADENTSKQLTLW
jgi:hypothetical protein